MSDDISSENIIRLFNLSSNKNPNFFFFLLLAYGSSVYRNQGYNGDYNAYLATDGQLSPGNSGFFHSNLEPYPALQIQLRKPDNSDYEAKDVNRVEIYKSTTELIGALQNKYN